MNILFDDFFYDELRQRRVKYDVHTTRKIKHTCTPFLSHTIFIAPRQLREATLFTRKLKELVRIQGSLSSFAVLFSQLYHVAAVM